MDKSKKQKFFQRFNLESDTAIIKIFIIFCFIIAIIFTLIFVFFSEYRINFSYAGSNCFSNFVLFPKIYKVESDTYSASFNSVISVKKTPIISNKTCLKIKNLPKQYETDLVKISMFNNSILNKKIFVESNKYPEVSSKITKNQKIATNKPLNFELSDIDNLFDYKLVAGDKNTLCSKKPKKVECDLKKLTLKHATFYDLKLTRVYKGKSIDVSLATIVETITPVLFNETSIKESAIVYDKPSSLVLVTDKFLKSTTNVTLNSVTNNKKKMFPVRSKINKNVVTVFFDTELQRETNYTLTIEDVEAVDGGSLVTPYNLSFKTSGGPKIVSNNIKNHSLSTNHTFVLDFDQAVDQNQDFNKLISLTSNGSKISYKLSVGDSQLTIKPLTNFAKCTLLHISLSNGSVSKFGITSKDSWSKDSRVTCFDLYTVGYSVKGKPIHAYKFGSGSNLITFVGSIHGNEQNSKKLLEKWIDELEANPNYPTNKTIVVIPSINPDGNTNNDRLNANGVDLNRNFPANNWKASVIMPSGQLLTNGGGPQPLSEPESKVIADYVTANRPGLLITYHSTGSVAIGNGSGNSDNLASIYSAKSGYTFKTNSTIGNYFNYDTTGALEDWMNDKLSMRAILVELRSRYDDEFYRNKSAMWAMAQMF